jgi:hypothetical protein
MILLVGIEGRLLELGILGEDVSIRFIEGGVVMATYLVQLIVRIVARVTVIFLDIEVSQVIQGGRVGSGFRRSHLYQLKLGFLFGLGGNQGGDRVPRLFVFMGVVVGQIFLNNGFLDFFVGVFVVDSSDVGSLCGHVVTLA